jgi:hypothetical protein
MNAEDTPNHILVDGNTESQRDLLGDAGTTPVEITLFQFNGCVVEPRDRFIHFRNKPFRSRPISAKVLSELALKVKENPSSEPEKVPVAVAGRNSPSKFAGSVGSEDVGPWWCTSPEAVHVMWMLTVPGTPPGAKN